MNLCFYLWNNTVIILYVYLSIPFCCSPFTQLLHINICYHLSASIDYSRCIVSLDCFTLIGLLRKKVSWHPPSMSLTCFHFAWGLLPASGASLCSVTALSQGVWLPMQKQHIKTNKASATYENASISTIFQRHVDARAHEAIFHSLPRLSASLSCNSASSLREAPASVILWNH